MRRCSSLSAAVVGALALSALLPLSPVAAQPRGGDGYLFKRPIGSVALRVGAARPNATGSVFDFAADQLTLGPNQYLGLAYAADVVFNLTPRAEVVIGVGLNKRRLGSEYRDWVDNDDKEIEQQTRFDRAPVTVGLRWNLLPAGRKVSRLAWVPNKVVPYVAAGGGTMYWRFRQEGDFVDFQDNTRPVFRAIIEDRGWTAAGYAATGVTWGLGTITSLNTELRYDLASAPLRGDFEGFNNIGLSGVGLTAGLAFRF